jgi:hypothetical protein
MNILLTHIKGNKIPNMMFAMVRRGLGRATSVWSSLLERSRFLCKGVAALSADEACARRRVIVRLAATIAPHTTSK